MRLRYALRSVAQTLSLCSLAILIPATSQSLAAARQPDIPAWLGAYVGTGEGQIALPVLQRARALYMRKVSEGKVRNPCYFAMDATRPNTPNDGKSAGRFYIVCEATQTI